MPSLRVSRLNLHRRWRCFERIPQRCPSTPVAPIAVAQEPLEHLIGVLANGVRHRPARHGGLTIHLKRRCRHANLATDGVIHFWKGAASFEMRMLDHFFGH